MSVPKSSLKKRGGVYYLHFFEHGVRRRVSLRTASLQVAKEKRRQFDSSRARGEEPLLPTRTPTAKAVHDYVEHIKATRTRNSVKADTCYLRKIFGPICPQLKRVRRRARPEALRIDKRRRERRIETAYVEQITAAQISRFLSAQVRRYNLAPKTANRYRDVLSSLFSWAMREGGVRMPGGVNPVSRVNRYKEQAPEIGFLTLGQVREQLDALAGWRQLQTMVAVLIFAGLRREELLWLTGDDLDLKTGHYGVIRVRAKTVGGESWQPKTKRNRAVLISTSLRGYLDRYEPRVVPGEWYFPSPEGKRWDPDNFSGTLRRVNGKVNLAWTCLTFRHTFGSQLALKGVSLYKIATLMGNSPEICRRHYAALIPEALADAVEFDATEQHCAGRPRFRLVSAG